MTTIQEPIEFDKEIVRKEKKRLSQKKYYDKNKEKIFALQYRDAHCESCNIDTKVYRLSKHKKTAKHIKNANKISTEQIIPNL